MEQPTEPDRNDLTYCPFCEREDKTEDHIRKCSGYKPSGMPNNETGHRYGCICHDCRDEYKRLKR